MSSKEEMVPAWLLERLRRGELPAAQAEEVRRRLTASGQLERLAELDASDAEILAAHPPAQVAAEIARRARVPARTTGRAWIWPTIPVLAAAMGLLLFVRSGGKDERTTAVTPTPEEILEKGQARVPSLRLYRKTADGHEAVGRTTPVRPGDTLQVRYLAEGRRYGVIASIDARGSVTMHLPDAGDAAAALERGDEQALPHSFQLDDSPGFEKFLFLTADRPFGTADAIRFLKGGTPPASGITAWEITLKKETP